MRERYRTLYSELAQKPSLNDKIGGGAGAQLGDDKRPHGKFNKQKTPPAGKNSPSVPPSYAPKDPGRESHTEEEVCMCGPRKELERYFAQENLQPVGMKIHISEHALGELQDFFGESNIKSIHITEHAAEKIPYFAKILAAYPSKSLNGRIYSAEVLDDAAKRYVGQPFILDHDYEDSYKVHGKIVGAHYGVDESPYLKRKREGLWLDAIGLMPSELVSLIKGEGAVPSLLRGVSIGGEGDAEPTAEGMKLKKFFPTELSVTAFPGIPGAHIADFQTVTESLKSS